MGWKKAPIGPDARSAAGVWQLILWATQHVRELRFRDGEDRRLSM